MEEVVKVCSFSGCTKPHYGKGLCNGHWQQLRRGQELTTLQHRYRLAGSAEERFLARVEKSQGCWTWLGGTFTNGYGQLKVNGSPTLAHRFSFELNKGVVPEGMMIDHICGNRLCVNPEHLQLATNKTNQENRGASKNSKTGVRGVWYVKSRGKYKACVKHDGHNYHVGYFTTIEEAEAAVIAKRNELFTNNLKDRKVV